MMRTFYFFTCFVLSFLTFNTCAYATDINKIRIGQHGDMTRIVLESTKKIKPDFFSLQSPPRFVLDFSKINFKATVDHLKLPKEGLVKGIRQGLFKPEVTRMVLDLKKPTIAKVFNIPAHKNKSNRLVIDLKQANKSQIAKQKEYLKYRLSKRKSKYKQPNIYERVTKKNNKVVVVLDPGHGGVDPGAIGKDKTYEKNVVLQIAKKLKKELEKSKNVKVYMTRTRDIFVPLKDRVKYAQRKNADIFVSIHADSHKNSKIKGGSVYALSDRASDKEAHRLARNANKGDLVAGVYMKDESNSVKNILIDLTQRETMNKSSVLAADILGFMRKKIPVRKKKVAFAGFRVLKAPEIPSVLVEVTYISNKTEEKKLKRRSHQQLIANSIAKGVRKFISKHRLN